MELRIKLNDELIKGLKAGYIKSSDMVKFVLSIEGSNTIQEDINNTSLSDIIINNHKVVSAAIDNYTFELVLTLSTEEYKVIEDKKVVSACKVNQYKDNKNYTICIDSANNVYISNSDNYNNKGYMSKGILISNNKQINSLLTGTYCQEAIDYLFSSETLKEYEQIKKDFNLKIELSTDEEYIRTIRKYIEKKVI